MLVSLEHKNREMEKEDPLKQLAIADPDLAKTERLSGFRPEHCIAG